MTIEKESGSNSRRHGGRLRLIVLGAVLILGGIVVGFSVGGLRGGGAAEEEAAGEDQVIWTCSMHPDVKLPEPVPCPVCGMELIPLDNDPAGPRELKMSRAAMALAEIQVEPVRRKYVSRPVRMVGRVVHDETRMAEISAWIPGRLDRLFVDYTGVTVRKGDHLVSMYSPDLVIAQRELLQTYKRFNSLGPGQDKQLVEATLRNTEEKLRLWGLLDEQIEQIKQRGTTSDHLTIYAPVGGIVTKKYANVGDYVQTGTKIYSIINLSHVWIYLNAYESDLPWLRYGQQVEVSTETIPGFEGKIDFIDPVLDETTRTVRVRVNVKNEDMRLKPGMFVRAIVRSRLDADGQTFGPSLAGKWISPMHPEIVKDGPGQCDVCGMDLVPAETLGLAGPASLPLPPLVIPATAPLITGKRAVVYVRVPTSKDLHTQIVKLWVLAGRPRGGKTSAKKLPTFDRLAAAIDETFDKAEQLKKWRDAAETPKPPKDSGKTRWNFYDLFDAIDTLHSRTAKLSEGDRPSVRKLIGEVEKAWKRAGELSDWEKPSFDGREITLGARAGDYYIVRHGLEEGQEVVTQGAFKIDSALQIAAKPSMMSMANLEIPAQFRQSLGKLYTPYFKLHEALGNDQKGSKLPEARIAWIAMQKALAAVPATVLDDKVAAKWKKIEQPLQKHLAAKFDDKSVDEVRKAFEPVAAEMLELVETFGHTGSETLYHVHCSMAFGNKGAAWLQSGRQIANPYFGYKSMISCSTIQRSFAPDAKEAEKTEDSQ